MPKVEKVKRAKSPDVMEGRPLCLEEFERMLSKVLGIVGDEAAESWRHYLWGLWWLGLRLSESLELFWDDSGKLSVDLTGRQSMLHIPAALAKGNQPRLLPIAPELAEFLVEIPEAERTGRVFQPQPRRRHGERLCHYRVSWLIGAIGKAAGVVVNQTRRNTPAPTTYVAAPENAGRCASSRLFFSSG